MPEPIKRHDVCDWHGMIVHVRELPGWEGDAARVTVVIPNSEKFLYHAGDVIDVEPEHLEFVMRIENAKEV